MKSKILGSIFFFVFITPSLTDAQSIWYGREKENSIFFEINKPFTRSDSLGTFEIPGLDAWSASYFLSGRYTLENNKNISFVADIPFSHGAVDDTNNLDNSQWMFGNPYIGAEFDIARTPIYFQLGFRLPFATENKGLAERTGVFSDFDRSEAFISHLFPIYGGVNYETINENKILFNARAGINLWFNDDSLNRQSNPSVRIDYQLQGGYMDKNLNVILTAVGRKFLSSNSVIKTKGYVLQYGLSIVVPYKKIRPALSFRIPGNDLSEAVLNYVIGLNFGYVF